MKKLFYTYTLKDPRDGQVKYVGATTNPDKRLYSHIKSKEGVSAKKEWIKDLSSNNMNPVMDIVGSFDSSELASIDECRLYDLHKNDNTLFCDDPKVRLYKPNLVDNHKHMITVKVTPGVELILKLLAESNNRSQGQQIEYMIKQEYSKTIKK